MATLSKSTAQLLKTANLENILQYTQKDDLAFLAFLIATGVFYQFFFKDKHDPYHHLWFEKPQSEGSGTTTVETRDISVKLTESEKDLVIFYGSQSGTGEGLANALVRDCRSRFGLNALAADLQDYDPESISRIPNAKFAIFILSTYGEGDPSDNATHFLSWLHSNKQVEFQGLRYAAFGLGNSKYKFYNKVVDVVVEGLDRLGAVSLLPTGRADDANGGTAEDFAQWKQSLFALFRNQWGMEEKPQTYEPTLVVVQDTSLEPIDLHSGDHSHSAGASKKSAANLSSIHALTVKSVSKLFTTAGPNCLHMELDTNEFPEFKYKTGDHLAVWPSNPNSEIQRLVSVLGLEGHLTTPLLITSQDSSVKVKIPSPTTWEALFKNYLEICAPVSREVVLALANFAPDNNSKATLKALGEDRTAYQTLCSQHHITFARLLQHVTTPSTVWSNIPVSFVIETLGVLTPRYYSISSSSVVSPNQIAITVATSSESSTQTIPHGVTTGYLLAIQGQKEGNAASVSPQYDICGPNNSLVDGTKLYAHVRKSKFRLPILPKTPVIMIASGSGIAPFRGFLTERARLDSIGREVGPSQLFFGCRTAAEYHYKEELEELEKTCKRVEITTAFSRTDRNGNNAKCYVQDRVAENEEGLIKLLMDENAYLYICGSAAMARDVAYRLGECMRKRLDWDEAQLSQWFDSMRKSHRWQEDVWG